MSNVQFIDPEALIDQDIFALLKLEDAPEETKQRIREDMMASIQNRVVARILDNLGEEETAQFDALIEEDNEEKMTEFLSSKNIDLPKITAEEALYYKTEIVNAVMGNQPALDTDNQAKEE